MAKSDIAAGIIDGLANAIREYSSLKSNQMKLMGELASNNLKMRQNWFYKQQEMQYQQQLKEQERQNAFNRLQQYVSQQNQSMQLPQGQRYAMGMTAQGTPTIISPGKTAIEIGRLRKLRQMNRLTPEGAKRLEALEAKYTGVPSFRGWLQEAIGRLKEGEDLDAVINEGREKYPDRMNFDIVAMLEEYKQPSSKESIWSKIGNFFSGEDNYSKEQEDIIKANMEYYNRPREEIVAALKRKGILR